MSLPVKTDPLDHNLDPRLSRNDKKEIKSILRGPCPPVQFIENKPLLYYIFLNQSQVTPCLFQNYHAELMEIIFGIENIKRPFKNPIVAMGNFDGVHRGHQKIFERVKEEASRTGGEAMIITFEPHPLKTLSPARCPPLLTPFRKRMRLIEQSGIETVLCIEFTLSFSRLSPVEFVEIILMGKVGPRKIIVGYNYHFGQNKSGDSRTLRTLCKPFQVEVEIVEPLILEGMAVSSSRIRGLIKNGRMEDASKLLGRDYFAVGKVIEGAGRGRTLGFPTANLEMTDELYPPCGVYAVEVIWNRQVFHGLANLGGNPTFQAIEGTPPGSVTLEVYILNFSRMIYGEEIQVNFKKRIRDEIRFGSAADLIAQIQKDIQWAQENVFP
jgi:riboflavin kinase / FMN adenylyltransferase